jgi:Transketolase, N-terminal subunit
MLTINEMNKKAIKLRLKVLDIVYNAKGGHIGGDMSSIDIFTSLYYGFLNIDKNNQNDPKRDKFVLSKGHCVEAYYSVLNDLGFISDEELATYSKFKSNLIGHPSNKVPGIEFNTGALGHGLSVGVGMAIGAKKCGFESKICVLMGDGELAEGSVWEAAMAASHYKLDNLIAIIDRNGLQISGSTEKVMSQEDLANRWTAFGFSTVVVEGHDIGAILDALNNRVKGKPTAIIAKTVKGKGVSFMENQAAWHHKVPTAEQYEQAKAELNQKLEAIA